MDFPENIHTPRLILKRLRRQNSLEFTALLAKESTRLESSFAGTLRLMKEDPEQYFQQCDLGWDGRTRFRLGLWKEQYLGGLIGLRSVELERGSAELFYFVAADFEGQGLAFEATKAVVDSAKEYSLNKLWLRVLPDNLRSVALAERLGFGAAEVLKQNYTTLDGMIHDTRVYRL